MANPMIIENDAGDRLQLVNGAWQPLTNRRAPGSAYLPASNLGDPDKSEAAYFRMMREKDDPGLAGARAGVAQARRMEGLLAKQEKQGQGTGGIYDMPLGIGKVAGWLDPEIREMDALQSEAARSKRQPGEGAISDFDAQQFLAMTYGKDKPTATNRALIQAQRVADDARIQRRQFMEYHYNTFGRASGAEEAWDRYAQDNPIFDPQAQSRGEVKLNGGRQNWRQYFGAARGPADTRSTQSEVDARRAAGGKPFKPMGWPAANRTLPPTLPKPQLAAAKMFTGAKAPNGSKGNPLIPTSEAEFDNMPRGASYIDIDGRVKTKRS